ncbi:hypothetical protein EDD66_102144 [Mobilisporobacter senegalensis]|uniref:Uncharacterized protein n=1 Tax=Mobilisporobacter senegalensis TaxID=1329262 RepID=A0A3N1XV55_9FIRM|nr:hypothetical protein EDD66_102144 [Mobilisporobacter senegalensis]
MTKKHISNNDIKKPGKVKILKRDRDKELNIKKVTG